MTRRMFERKATGERLTAGVHRRLQHAVSGCGPIGCSTCGCWEEASRGIGRCRANAPRSHLGGEDSADLVVRAIWPTTGEDDWCMQWRPQDAGADDRTARRKWDLVMRSFSEVADRLSADFPEAELHASRADVCITDPQTSEVTRPWLILAVDQSRREVVGFGITGDRPHEDGHKRRPEGSSRARPAELTVSGARRAPGGGKSEAEPADE